MKKTKTILFYILIFLMLESCFGVVAYANPQVFYVSMDGTDADGNGSLQTPLKTISFAASKMRPGDVCYIRGGVYRESVQISINGNSQLPVSFSAYNDESVTISGCDEISGFSKYSDNIYFAPMNWDVYDGSGNMLFSNGKLGQEARWPNSTDLLDRNTYSVVDSATNDGAITITCNDIPDDDYTGALLWCSSGVEYWSYVSPITGFDNATKTLTVKNVFYGEEYYPEQGDIFYITKSFATIDSPGEWYKDTKNGLMYFYAPDGAEPTELNIEAKRRKNAVLLKNSNYVVFDKINIQGATLNMTAASSNCTFKNATIEAVDCNYPLSGGQGSADGIIVDGSFNTISGCEIKNNFGEGVLVSGLNNKIINNYIHDVNYQHTYSDGIRIMGKNHLVSHNTVAKTGRSTIGGTFTSSVISYNDLSDSNRLSKDGGVIYLNANDYGNSEIHHNIIHDSLNNQGQQDGIYFDSQTSNFSVYNNLIYNMDNPLPGRYGNIVQVNPGSQYNLFFNNTIVNNRGLATYLFPNSELTGTVFINNLFKTAPFAPGVVQQERFVWEKNLVEASSFTNASQGDYTLSQNSAGIDGGMFIPGVTEGFMGSAPDCGAFEKGILPWTAGHNFSVEFNDRFTLNSDIPYKNLLKNRGFESNLENWEVKSGTPSVFTQDAWEYWMAFTMGGTKGLMLKPGDVVSQSITGLKPNTTYTVDAFLRNSGSFYAGSAYSQGSGNFVNKGNVVEDLTSGSWVTYENVAIDAGESNRIVVGMKKANLGASVTVKENDHNGEIIAVVNLNQSLASESWQWSEVVLDENTLGTRKLCFVFEGNLTNTLFGGFYLDNTNSDESSLLRAVSDSDESVQITSGNKKFGIVPVSVDITTGALGTVNVSLEKNSGILYMYMDNLGFKEKFVSNAPPYAPELYIENLNFKNLDNQKVNSFLDEDFILTQIDIGNNTNKTLPLNGSLESFDAEDNSIDFCNIDTNISPQKELGLGFGINVVRSGKSYMIFTLEQSGGRYFVEYRITEQILKSEITDNLDFCLVDVMLTNSSGERIYKIQPNEQNVINTTFKTLRGDKPSATGIVALYSRSGGLLDLQSKVVDFSLNDEQDFTMNMTIPNQDGLYLKIFFLDSIDNIKPFYKSYTIK